MNEKKRWTKKDKETSIESYNEMLPPYNADIESIVLGTIILDKDIIHSCIQDFNESLFFSQQNKDIANAILALYQRNVGIDLLTIVQELKKTNGSVDILYITGLTNRVASTTNFEHHFRILQEDALKRLLINVCGSALRKSFENSEDVFKLFSTTQIELDNAIKNVVTYQVAKVGQVHNNILKVSYDCLNSGVKSGVETGLTMLDNVTNGWQKSDLIILAGRPSMGKALRNSSVVYTPSGFTQIGKINVSDQIIGSDGEVYQVTGVFPQGKKQVYRVSFDDGTFVDCCEDHLWCISTRNDRKMSKKRNGKQSVLTTKEMIDGFICLNDGRRNYSINFCKPLNFTEKEISLNPYLLGAIIGDGCSYVINNAHTLRISNSEEDVLKKIDLMLPVSDQLSYQSKYDYTIKRKLRNNKVSDTCAALVKLGLFGKKSFEKFIPKEYLYNSVNVRVELLQGLIDTDGFVYTKGLSAIEYSTTSKQLCYDILELVRGLGGKASYKTKQGSYTNDGIRHKVREYYRMYLSLPIEIIPVSSKKHLSKYGNTKKYHSKFITDIKKTEEFDEMTCISVNSPDNLFITDGYTLTHNTAAAISMILHPAIDKKEPIAIFSLEMSTEQLVSRMQSILSSVNVGRIVKKQLNIDEIQSIERNAFVLNDAPIYIDDTAAISLMALKGKARKLVNECGVKLIVIDYLQLMRSGLNTNNRESEIAEISRGLKAIAKELNIPVIALSQLSRQVESRADKKPQLSDLRESGQIEQDADMVLFCYRPEYYGIDNYEVGGSEFQTDGLFMLLIEKHRNGELGEVPLKFIHHLAKVTNLISSPNEFGNQSNYSTFVQQETTNSNSALANARGGFDSMNLDETPF